jgi:hypothetical protein
LHFAARARNPQLPFAQTTGGMHSASEAQLARHCPLAGSHVNGVQMMVGPARQEPFPSQTFAPITRSAWHAPAPQTVPASWSRQLPEPSQVPERPQLAGDSGGQSAAVRGWSPRGLGMQVPTTPGAVQVSQPPEQALEQQTPSTQNPLRH